MVRPIDWRDILFGIAFIFGVIWPYVRDKWFFDFEIIKDITRPAYFTGLGLILFYIYVRNCM